MAIQQPVISDKLISPDHSLSHRVFANDNAAPVQSIVVNSSGNVGIGTTNPETKAVVHGDSLTIEPASFSGLNAVSKLEFKNVGYARVSGANPGASIEALTTSYVNDLGLSTDLLFKTGAVNGGTSPNTEKMRIASTGNVGIGTTSPTALLTIKAGTATANTAPLKFTSGTLNTTAEVGAVEFLTDDYYGTITTNTVRRKFVMDTTGRATGQTAANASVATYTLGAADASFEVSANVLVTTSSAEAFTTTVDYTDEGNTARVITLNFQLLVGTIGTAIAFANGAVPYEGLPVHIRCKASTAITVKTAAGGTYTGATYSVEAVIKKI